MFIIERRHEKTSLLGFHLGKSEHLLKRKVATALTFQIYMYKPENILSQKHVSEDYTDTQAILQFFCYHMLKPQFFPTVAQLIKSFIDAEVHGIKIFQEVSFMSLLPNDFYLKVYYRVVIQLFLF